MTDSDTTERGTTRRRTLTGLGAAGVTLTLAGCTGGDGTPTPSPTETGTPTEQQTPTGTVDDTDVTTGGTFTYGMSANPDTSNILRSGSVYSAVALLGLVYTSGITTDPVTYEPKPWVFTDWTIENADSDKPDVYFNLREGVTWATGEELTLEDVIWSHNYILENEPGEYSGFISACETWEKADKADWDGHVKMAKQVGTWETTVLGNAPLLPRAQWEGKNFEKFEPVQGQDGEAYSVGPGKLTRFDADTSMQVVFREGGEPINPGFYENLSNLQWRQDHKQIIAGGPFIDKVNFKVYGSESAMTQAFLQGDLDTHYGSMQTSKIEQVEENADMGLVDGFDSGFSYHAYNLRRKPFDDVAFRQVVAMIWDEYYWLTRLQRNYAIQGDYPHSPGYRAARPETVFDGELLSDPSSEAFTFRQSQPGVPDIEGLKGFLKDGKVISEPGTYVGKEFPGTLSGVKASQSEAQYDYTWGPVKSEVLKNEAGVNEEIRLDGKTIPELKGNGEPIVFLIDPPQNSPREAKAIANWVSNAKSLGIPVKTKVLSFNTMVGKVYQTEEFDMYNMGWGGTNPYGTSLYFFFHSDMADSTGDNDGFVYNSTGYGVVDDGYDEQIKDAYETTDLAKMSEKFAKANERIYLDQPYMVRDYTKMKWPMQTSKWKGYVGNVVDPAYASWSFECFNLHKRE